MGKELDAICYPFQCQVGVGEYFPGFLLEGLELLILRAEMTNNEPMHASLLGDGGCLGRGAVKPLDSLFGEVL